MLPINAYKIGLVLIFPISLAIHGWIWVTTNTSSSLAVYAMKLALVPFVVLAALAYGNHIFKFRKMRMIACLAIIPTVFFAVVPFAIPDELNIFYYVSDIVGLLIFFLAVAVFYVGLRQAWITIENMERVAISFLVMMSIYIIIYFILSGGEKVNLPPEMHLSITIVIGAYFFRLPGHSPVQHWLIILVAVACILSQFRVNLGVFGIALIACLLRALFYRRLNKRLAASIVLLSILSLTTAPFYWSILSDRLDSLSLAEVSNSSDAFEVPKIFEDQSLNQRFIERSLILIEMNDPAYSIMFGKGAGAQYANFGNVLENYGERVHHAHPTPYVMLLRMGFIGVILYFLPMVIGMFSIFSRDDFVFRSSLSLILFYGTQFLDQYLFWGVQFAGCLALWLYSFDRRRAGESRNLIR